MSLPTTPTRSVTFSTSSTPSTNQHGGSPQQLTPRSKIKAMLAAIDDDSDPEIESIESHKNSSRRILSTIATNVQKPDVRKSREHRFDCSDEEDGSDDMPIVPRGSLAARLNGYMSKSPHLVSANEYGGKENAYARIRKQLLRDPAMRACEISSGSESDIVPRKRSRSRGSMSSRLKNPNSPSTHLSSQENSPIRSRRTSPGLFLTPGTAAGRYQSPEKAATNQSPDPDLPEDPQTNSRFLKLVARKRVEREAKQAEEDRKRADKIAKQRTFEEGLSRNAASDSGLSDEDKVADRRLTQQARPTRKASKRALEELNRETQRMSRNMQLAHQAKTKKKITKDSLFARFNFRITNPLEVEAPQILPSSTAASSAPPSDMESIGHKESPPTSPVGLSESPVASTNLVRPVADQNADPEPAGSVEDGLPDMVDLMSQPAPEIDRGRGKARKQTERVRTADLKNKKMVLIQPAIRIHPPRPSSGSKQRDSDSELEIMPSGRTKRPKNDVFDRLPGGKVQETRSLQTLRALAHLNSPEKQRHGNKAMISLRDMQTSLQRRARQQAAEERTAKIADLKRRGITVQTAEERQKDQAEVEDLLEKARRDGEELMQKEKRAAKRAKIAKGEVGELPDTSDEDEDYLEDASDEEIEVEFSESEEEQGDSDGLERFASEPEESNEGEDESNLDFAHGERNDLVDNEASEDGDEEEGGDDVVDDLEEEDHPSHSHPQRSRRNKTVLADDDDDDDYEVRNTQNSNWIQKASVEPPIFPSGLLSSKNNCIPMGMTQAFAATMAETQTQASEADKEHSLAFLGPPPDPYFPMLNFDDSPRMIEDSQKNLKSVNTASISDIETFRESEIHFSQSQIRYDVLGNAQGQVASTQVSEIPDPTQDVGIVLSSPPPERFASAPPSTVDTVLLPRFPREESPIKKKKGRLQRGAHHQDKTEHVDQVSISGDALVGGPPNAFDVMKKVRGDTSANDAFDKKKSEAKTMVEEQAQESEDEYAGLGGASDDESGGEEDEFVREMIDQGEIDVDERQLAAFYANKERVSDERAVEKLFKDINSGMLRRKRGAEFDLSDSEDDAEARQRRKRREFAKMRKTLLENENVGKIAEDPKKLAFLRAIEDRDDDEDLDFLDRPAEDSFRIDVGTQENGDSQSQQPAQPEALLGKPKRPPQETLSDKGNMRPPAAARRIAAPKKPATLAEIRESVSFLIEEPGSITMPPDPSSSASEDEPPNQGNQHIRPRRRTSTHPIIDRLSLKRVESASTSSTSRLAFHDPSSNSSIGGFKVPALLRRATTSQLNARGADANGISTAAAATERAAGGGEKGECVRRGGTKRSSVNYFSREGERRGAVEGLERRRREEREREARKRRNGLGGLGVGAFE